MAENIRDQAEVSLKYGTGEFIHTDIQPKSDNDVLGNSMVSYKKCHRQMVSDTIIFDLAIRVISPLGRGQQTCR